MKPVKPQKTNAVALYRNEAFDAGFYQYFANKSSNPISKVLNSKERNLKFETISYREMNSWEKAGLLTVARENREWRRFSIIDAIWVKLIKELREFGVTWKQLKVAKESLEFESEKCGTQMPLLEFYTAFVLAQRLPVVLLVFKDGVTIPVSFTQYKVAKETAGIPNHVQITLNDLIQGMVPELDLSPVHQFEMLLGVDEMELLAFLRVGEYEKVEVRYKNGKIDIIEGMERIKATKKLHSILSEQEYANIEIIQEGGKVIGFIRKTKRRLNK